MYFLLVGVIALALRFFEVAPVAGWSWFIVLAPFALAVAWWAWADSSGYTKRREMDKMAKRKEERIEKQRVAMGMLDPRRRRK